LIDSFDRSIKSAPKATDHSLLFSTAALQIFLEHSRSEQMGMRNGLPTTGLRLNLPGKKHAHCTCYRRTQINLKKFPSIEAIFLLSFGNIEHQYTFKQIFLKFLQDFACQHMHACCPVDRTQVEDIL